MINLWLKVRFKKGTESKISIYRRFFCTYILPTLVVYIFLFNSNKTINSKISLEIYSIVNLLIISLTHYFIQKLFFPKLEGDVIIKFIPEQSYNYIKMKVLSILVMWNLPFILPTLLDLRKIFFCSSLPYCIVAILFLFSWFLLNYLITLYLRYMLNTYEGVKKGILNTAIFLTFIMIIILPNYFFYKFLDNNKFNNFYLVNPINLNNYYVIMLLLICLITLIISQFTKKYFQDKIRFIIESKKSSSFKILEKNKRLEQCIKLILDICSIKLSYFEKKIFIKDIKTFCRKESKTLLVILLSQIGFTSFLLYIYCCSIPNSSSEIFDIMLILQITIFLISIVPSLFLSNFALINYLKIDKDINLLKEYDIKINTMSLINAKKRFIIIISYFNIFIFYFIAFITIFNVWSSITIILSFILDLIVINLLSLIFIKFLNNLNSENILIRTFNYFLAAACIIMVRIFFTSESIKDSIILYISINIVLLISYFYNYKININKIKKEV